MGATQRSVQACPYCHLEPRSMAPRRTLDETRALLLETGASMFVSAETTVSLDAITIIDVCREAGLKTGGSAYKIWPQQNRFREDLFHYLLDTLIQDNELLDALRHEIEVNSANLPPLSETIRTFGADALHSWLNGRAEFILYLAFFLIGHTNPDVARAISQSDSIIIETYAAIYAAIIEANDREFVPPYDATTLALTFAALADGMMLLSRASEDLITRELQRPTGPNGEEQPWTNFASALEAITGAFTRPRSNAAQP